MFNMLIQILNVNQDLIQILNVNQDTVKVNNKCLIEARKTRFIKHMKVLGALVNPKRITNHSYKPCFF